MLLIILWCGWMTANFIIQFIIPQVHGGTTARDIIRKVRKAEELARNNRVTDPRIDTVLFLDETNTTEAISLIKEIMCDRTMNGEPLDRDCGLKLIAACNPYRK